MIKIFLFLIIQIFQISLNDVTKELPIYGEVKSVNNEMIFLKTDLFTPVKNIEFILMGKVYGGNPFIFPAIKMKYCFVQQKEDSCTFLDVSKFSILSTGIDGLYVDYYYTTTIIMNDRSNYLIFTLEIKDADSLMALGVHGTKLLNNKNK